MLSLTRTNAQNPDYIKLIKFLDADLAEKDGDEHAFYAQFNKSDLIKHVIVAYLDEVAVGCGAIKEYQPGVTEVKRMFVSPEVRGKGIASHILTALEDWAKELGYTTCILETGKKQVEAIALYQKNNYKTIPNYGQYTGVANSLCFEKKI